MPIRPAKLSLIGGCYVHGVFWNQLSKQYLVGVVLFRIKALQTSDILAKLKRITDLWIFFLIFDRAFIHGQIHDEIPTPQISEWYEVSRCELNGQLWFIAWYFSLFQPVRRIGHNMHYFVGKGNTLVHQKLTYVMISRWLGRTSDISVVCWMMHPA